MGLESGSLKTLRSGNPFPGPWLLSAGQPSLAVSSRRLFLIGGASVLASRGFVAAEREEGKPELGKGLECRAEEVDGVRGEGSSFPEFLSSFFALVGRGS